MPSVAEIFETMEYGPAPESATTALQWIQERTPFRHFIGGGWRPSADGITFETVNPAIGRALARVSQGGPADVDAAVEAARKAQPGWRALGGYGRARFLYAIARHVQKHSRLLAVLETLDNGKPIRETRDIDIPLVARHFYHHAGWAHLMERELPGYEPVGVAGQIIPWNFPLLMLAWKIAPAIAMGNTVVLKPAEFTPLTALAFAGICAEIGLPPGVVNVVTGDGATGELLVNHSGVDKIAFTGSTEVGRLIRRATAGTGKRISLELGGKSPFVVFEDADLDSVVEGVVDAIWFNQGQVCCAGSRLLVQESVADRLHRKLKARMETLRVGDPLDKTTDIGAIIAPVQLHKIQELVKRGAAEGADLWQPSWASPTEGCFYPPTLFTNVAPAAEIAQVEIFGPVLVSMTFRTPAEAVELANNTRYGLAASIWSENINLALDIAPKIKAGTVWINSTNLFDAASGFGGYGESGFGREGGREGLWEYVKRRVWEKGSVGVGECGSVEAGDRVSHTPTLPHSHTSPLPVDRTAKLYVGGKQARPDSGYSLPVVDSDGRRIGEVGEGNRKDIRNAVEAARGAATSWSRTTGHGRAQILYYVAENLEARAVEFGTRLASFGSGGEEVARSVERLFEYAAWADKLDGAVHHTPLRNVTIAMPEPIGVIGIACPDHAPLLAFVTLMAAAICQGNTVVIVPSEQFPLAATDFYQVLDTSDVPGGVVNIVTGRRDVLAEVLAAHDDVDAMWYMGPAEGATMVERASAGNMKRTWVSSDGDHWASTYDSCELLREAVQIKNIWIPYGE